MFGLSEARFAKQISMKSLTVLLICIFYLKSIGLLMMLMRSYLVVIRKGFVL